METLYKRTLQQARALASEFETSMVSVRHIDGTILEATGSEELLGYKSSEIVGRNMYRLYSYDTPEPLDIVEYHGQVTRGDLNVEGELVWAAVHMRKKGGDYLKVAGVGWKIDGLDKMAVVTVPYEEYDEKS